MKLSPKAQTSLDKVLQRFRSGDISAIVDVAKTRLPDDAPAAAWSWGNRILAYAQSSCMDCRGYRQWQKAGRQVQKGASACYIFGPHMVRDKDDDTDEDRQRLVGWLSIAVFPATATEGEPLNTDYKPADLPPLADLAKKLGIAVTYQPTKPGNLGTCAPDGSDIKLGTKAPEVWYHELAHAIDAKLDKESRKAHHAPTEILAEFTACVLMELYLDTDSTGNAWAYISPLADDPLQSVIAAAQRAGRIIEFLEAAAQEATP